MTTFQGAYRELQQAQKSSKGVSFYSRLINRPIGRLLAAGLHTAGLGPNAVTALSAVATLAGLLALVLLPNTLWQGLAVALLLVLGFALDSADGQVARLAGVASPAGEWADHVVDAGKMVLVHAAVMIYAFRNDHFGLAWLLVPLLFQLVSTVQFAGMIIYELLLRAHAARGDSPAARAAAPSALRSLGLLPADYGILCLSFVFVGVPLLFRISYTALAVLNLAICLMLLVKWFRSLRAGAAG